MELSKYVGKKVRVDLNVLNYFYEGVVLGAEDTCIELVDRRGKLVTISINTISFIREVGE